MGEGSLFISKREKMPKVCCKSECQNCSELGLPSQQQQALYTAFWHLQCHSQIFLSKGCSQLLFCLFQKCSGAGWKQSPVMPGFVQTKPRRQLLLHWLCLTIVLLKCNIKCDAILLAINKMKKILCLDLCQVVRCVLQGNKKGPTYFYILKTNV